MGKVGQIKTIVFAKTGAGKSESDRIVAGFHDPDALLTGRNGRTELEGDFGRGRVNPGTASSN